MTFYRREISLNLPIYYHYYYLFPPEISNFLTPQECERIKELALDAGLFTSATVSKNVLHSGIDETKVIYNATEWKQKFTECDNNTDEILDFTEVLTLSSRAPRRRDRSSSHPGHFVHTAEAGPELQWSHWCKRTLVDPSREQDYLRSRNGSPAGEEESCPKWQEGDAVESASRLGLTGTILQILP